MEFLFWVLKVRGPFNFHHFRTHYYCLNPVSSRLNKLDSGSSLEFSGVLLGVKIYVSLRNN